MTALKKQDIKELATDELKEKITELKKNYQRLKFTHAVSPVDNPMTIKTMRRDIARLMTEMSLRNKMASAS